MLDGARMRMARKPSALARDLLRNFPKGKRRRGGRRRRRKGGGESGGGEEAVQAKGGAQVETPSNGSGRSKKKDGPKAPERDAA